jgi:hypothetical protein
MTAIVSPPKFSLGQHVTFVGGEGCIRSCKIDSGSWTYLIEMAKGPEPKFGRVGFETMILVVEADLSVFRESEPFVNN